MGNAGSTGLVGRLWGDSSSNVLDRVKGKRDEELFSAVHNTKLFSFRELHRATDNFSPNNKIGSGGFGDTYKGVLPDGTLIATEVLSDRFAQGKREFMNIVSLLAKLEHENLVKLYGCCVEANHRIIVYDYLENGNLAQSLLHSGPGGIDFPWDVRRRICIGVAMGLAFLHDANILHRDIKAANILLDNELNPKISDFSLARSCSPDVSDVSNQIAGTYGYMAPEYAAYGQLSIKADIYSFGILILEIVCGTRNISMTAERSVLLVRAWDLHRRGQLLELVDKSITGDFFVREEAYKYLIISLLCTELDPGLRPDMYVVIGMLTGKIDVSGENLSRSGLLSQYGNPRVDKGEVGSDFSYSPGSISSDTLSHRAGPELETVEKVQMFDKNSGSTSHLQSMNLETQLENRRTIIMCVGLGWTEAPKTDEWLTAKEIYLTQSWVTELPESPRCPLLKALYLHRNNKLRAIPISFFEYMPALQVLNLSRTRIKTLPDSLFLLQCLKRLFMRHCELLTVLSPKIGELKQLELLDLHGTEIINLPEEVVNLTNLRSLELSFSGHSERNGSMSNVLIPGGTICALSQLEELSIDVDPEDERWETNVNAILDDIRGLRMLYTLKLYFPFVKHLRNINWYIMPIECFKFSVGRHANRIMSRFPQDLEHELKQWDRCLKYVNGVGISADIKKVLLHSTAFFLDRHTTATKLSEFGIKNMQQLKCCVLGECNQIRYLLDGFDFSEEESSGEILSEYPFDEFVLGSLNYLRIYYMKNFRGIYTGPYRKCLCNLKSLTLQTCPELTSIFTPELLGDLSNLEELTVEYCDVVTSLVTFQEPNMFKTSYSLPKLKRMSLHNLPQLVSISYGLRIGPKLELISLCDCPKLNLSVEEVGNKSWTKIKEQGSLSLSHTSSSEAKQNRSSKGKSVEGETEQSKHLEEKSIEGKAKQSTASKGKLVEGEVRQSRSSDGEFVEGMPIREVVPTPIPRAFTLAELKSATRNFHSGNILGEGGLGRVFKGVLHEKSSLFASDDGTAVAIKFFKVMTFEAWDVFKQWESEEALLASLSHPNIIRLLGYCLEEEMGFLVYEYMHKGSLDNHLFKKSAVDPLSWNLRLKIAIGAARGLAFLHQLEVPLIQRDFTASNILLDADYNAKISGLRLGRRDLMGDESHVTTRVMGTYGYAAPEYVATGKMTIKSGVYSFGVVLLEILTGLRAVDNNRPSGQHELMALVQPHVSKRKLASVVDPKLKDQYPLKQALALADLAFQCLRSDDESRPSMIEVVEGLEKIQGEAKQGTASTGKSVEGLPTQHVGPTQELKVVLKLGSIDIKTKKKAMRIVSGIEGVASISAQTKEETTMTVTGSMDPVTLFSKLRKLCPVDIVSVGPAADLTKTKNYLKIDRKS